MPHPTSADHGTHVPDGDLHDDLPVVVGGARRRPLRTALRLLGVVLVVLIAMWSLTAVATDLRLARLAIPAVGGGEAADGITNILIVGTDSRAGLSDEQLLAMGTEAVDGSRTDTVLLLQVSPHRAAPVMLSFPRDLRVVNPAGKTGKINAVHGSFGPDGLTQVVEATTGLQIDHYVEIDIAGVLLLTDAVGGVEVCLEQPMQDVFAGVDLPAGCQELDGIQASGFVRARHTADTQFGRDDLGRIARQQYFISRAVKTALSPTTLVNPLDLKRLSDVAATAMRVDDQLGAVDEAKLAWSMRKVATGEVERLVLPSSWQSPYMVTDDAAATALYDRLRVGQ